MTRRHEAIPVLSGPRRVRSQYRFFVPPDRFTEKVVRLPDKASAQIRRVLRLKSGDTVLAFDGTGFEYLVELGDMSREIVGKVVARNRNTVDPSVTLEIYPAIMKAKKLELVVQKCTEVGAAVVTPVVCDRSVPEIPSPTRMERFEEIARAASEQSGRGLIPSIRRTMSFREAMDRAPAMSILFTESREDSSVKAGCLERELSAWTGSPMGIFTGPEGGFSEAEVELALSRGYELMSLGPRTLRAETAAIVATALVLHILERATQPV